MFKKGYHIYKEIAIKDKHFYIITYYKYGKKKTNPILSPFLTNNKEYMQYLYNYYYMKFSYETKKLQKIKYKNILLKIKKIINKENGKN